MQHVGRAGALVGFAFQACGAGAIVVLPAPYQQWVGLTLIGVGSVTLLVTIIWWLRHNRIHLADRIVQVEPVYIIIIGLAIAASGAVWQYYQVSMAKSGAPYISQNPGRLSNAETKSPKAAPPEHAPIQQPAASPKYDLPPDEKIRLRKSVADLAAIFDSDGLQTINLTQKLLDFVGDFQNPEDKNNIMPTVLLPKLNEINDHVEAFSNKIFKDFLPSHRYDIAEMNDLVVSKSVLYELSQSTLSLIGDLHTIEIVDQKSSDKTATRYALSLLVPRYKIFSSSADAFKKWFDECNKKMEDRKNSLR